MCLKLLPWYPRDLLRPHEFSDVVEVMMKMMKEKKEYVNNKSNPPFGSPNMLSKLVSSANRSLEIHTENKMKFKVSLHTL
jgi:hypothetical protein